MLAYHMWKSETNPCCSWEKLETIEGPWKAIKVSFLTPPKPKWKVSIHQYHLLSYSLVNRFWIIFPVSLQDQIHLKLFAVFSRNKICSVYTFLTIPRKNKPCLGNGNEQRQLRTHLQDSLMPFFSLNDKILLTMFVKAENKYYPFHCIPRHLQNIQFKTHCPTNNKYTLGYDLVAQNRKMSHPDLLWAGK